MSRVRLLAQALSTAAVQAEAASIMLNAMRKNRTPMSTNPSLMKLLLSEDILHLNGKVEEIDSGLVCDFFGTGH